MTRPQTERRLHGGRNLTGYRDDEDEHAGWPEVAYEAIRAINHLTFGGAMPAPLVYDVLGNLKGVGHLLPQALGQLSQGLADSLSEYDVYERDGREPAQSVTDARAYLVEAAEKAAELGTLLEAAQSAISGQGYRSKDEQ